ncbi:vanadium-dependent haloperoxidase [Methylobacterium brachiatum]|uniref:vanadium-dependent haloperoxidase n=1 Tax=Methylobacterium brachiatum TaxID=269660 RepID=UPI00244C7F0C|nr:vanadium-dependent haloperoxidase [Methylobacterium brachiatum]MDH2313896.1 phosphatase PAP2 family protein [Methylobacterium brachiatum]
MLKATLKSSVALFVYESLLLAAQAQTVLTPESQSAFQRVLSPQSDRQSIARAQTFTVRAARDAYSRLLVWNEVAMEVTAADHARGPNEGYDQLGPHRASRAIAIVHLAMYDAINSITRKYVAYSDIADATDPQNPACIDTAISAAARTSMLALFPREQNRINDAYNRDLSWAKAACEAAQTMSDVGTAIGEDATRRILTLRSNDNSAFNERDAGTQQQAADNPSKYVYVPSDPGKWQIDPVSMIPTALGYDWGKVRPFILKDISLFRPPPHPALTDAKYTSDYNDVKSIGAASSLKRKPLETFVGIFWAYDGTPELCAPPRLYNQYALQVVEQNQQVMSPVKDVSDLARYLAAINTAMADTAIVTWEAKWREAFWRPVTAIRYQMDDGNPETQPDASFVPLGAPATNGRGPNFTPPFPAYPSGHAAFGGALFGIMRTFYNENTSVVFVSDEFNGLNKDPIGQTRSYRSREFLNFSQPEWENARSRIYLGIHWQADADEGVTLGRKVAEYISANAFLPRHNILRR